MKLVLLFLIRTYRYLVSPLFPPHCRFYPTCSEYAFIAISRWGVFKGFYMAFKRIMRCHPFSEGGYDPVE